MSLLSSILLGLIQGVAEFLPISSSGHLAIAEHLLGMTGLEIPEFFDVLLHLGTLLAVFAAYWDDIWISKANGKVSLSNMYDDYDLRPELLKSKQFYNNAFQTSVNYEDLMKLKKELMRA